MANTEDTRTATGRLAADLPMPVVELAAWSAWTRFDRLPAAAPRLPRVYLAATTTALVYVGMAGDRRGTGLRGTRFWCQYMSRAGAMRYSQPLSRA